MRILNLESRHIAVVCGMLVGTCAALNVMPRTPAAAEKPTVKGQVSGTFVSFKDGTLTIKSHAKLLEYKQVNEAFKTYLNNEDGPGVKLVETTAALGRAVPGTVIHVDVDQREISCGLDNRLIGTFVSYRDGKLTVQAAEVPPGFIQKPTGKIGVTVTPDTPVLESIDGGDFKFAGVAGDVLKTVKEGAVVTARSEYDPGIIEVIQIGRPRRMMERYIGQTRATVRGTFISFKDNVLTIRGKGVASLAADEYERTIRLFVADNIPIVESIDGGKYQPTTIKALKLLKEGEIVTIRRVEIVILEIQIGVAKSQ